MEQKIDVCSHLLLLRGLKSHNADLLGLELLVVARVWTLDEEHVVDFSWRNHQRLVLHVKKVGHFDLLCWRGLVSWGPRAFISVA